MVYNYDGSLSCSLFLCFAGHLRSLSNKEIFKNHGLTIAFVLLGAEVTIGAFIGAITSSLRGLGKSLGNGLKEIGKKIASIFPELLGSIVSFIFNAVGEAIGFLLEHTWLLILAAVAFLMERYIKKRR